MKQYRQPRNRPTNIINWSLQQRQFKWRKHSLSLKYFLQRVLEKLDIILPKITITNVDPDLLSFTKVNSKWIIDQWLPGGLSEQEVGETQGFYRANKLFSMIVYGEYVVIHLSKPIEFSNPYKWTFNVYKYFKIIWRLKESRKECRLG